MWRSFVALSLPLSLCRSLSLSLSPCRSVSHPAAIGRLPVSSLTHHHQQLKPRPLPRAEPRLPPQVRHVSSPPTAFTSSPLLLIGPFTVFVIYSPSPLPSSPPPPPPAWCVQVQHGQQPAGGLRGAGDAGRQLSAQPAAHHQGAHVHAPPVGPVALQGVRREAPTRKTFFFFIAVGLMKVLKVCVCLSTFPPWRAGPVLGSWG